MANLQVTSAAEILPQAPSAKLKPTEKQTDAEQPVFSRVLDEVTPSTFKKERSDKANIDDNYRQEVAVTDDLQDDGQDKDEDEEQLLFTTQQQTSVVAVTQVLVENKGINLITANILPTTNPQCFELTSEIVAQEVDGANLDLVPDVTMTAKDEEFKQTAAASIQWPLANVEAKPLIDTDSNKVMADLGSMWQQKTTDSQETHIEQLAIDNMTMSKEGAMVAPQTLGAAQTRPQTIIAAAEIAENVPITLPQTALQVSATPAITKEVVTNIQPVNAAKAQADNNPPVLGMDPSQDAGAHLQEMVNYSLPAPKDENAPIVEFSRQPEIEVAQVAGQQVHGDKFGKKVVAEENNEIQVVVPQLAHEILEQAKPEIAAGTERIQIFPALQEIQLPIANRISSSQQGSMLTTDGLAEAYAGLSINNSDWEQGIGNRILWMLDGGIKQVSIQVEPAELGPLGIQLRVFENKANIIFTSNNYEVKGILEAATPALHQMLDENGLGLGQVQVNISSEQFTGNGNNRGFHQQQHPTKPSNLLAANIIDNNQDSPIQTRGSIKLRGLIDYYA